jgi:hypothetical protein
MLKKVDMELSCAVYKQLPETTGKKEGTQSTWNITTQ